MGWVRANDAVRLSRRKLIPGMREHRVQQPKIATWCASDPTGRRQQATPQYAWVYTDSGRTLTLHHLSTSLSTSDFDAILMQLFRQSMLRTLREDKHVRAGVYMVNSNANLYPALMFLK